MVITQRVMVFFHGQLLGHRRVTHFEMAVPPSCQQQPKRTADGDPHRVPHAAG